jgi:spermidine synthase
MDTAARRTWALGALFFGSGAAALIYEIAWFQQLTLVLGATAVSLAILLTSFLGGMCLGSVAAPHVVPRRWTPLAAYAVLELLMGAYGVASLWVLPWIGSLYAAWGAPGQHDLLLRSLACGLVLLPPTMLMGATLPVIARGVNATRDGVSQLGWFYGANTLGAVAGCLTAGLVLLRLFDVAAATLVAAALNGLLAAVAWRLSRGEPETVPADSVRAPQHRESSVLPSATFGVACVTLLSGLTALGAETVWTRLLGLLFGPSGYTFSILLAVFLLGLGAGSALGAAWGRRTSSPLLALAVTQLSLLAAIPYAAWMIASVLPHWWGSRDPAISLPVHMVRDVLRTAATCLPATLLWGAAFPLAVAAAANPAGDASRLVARLYAANTLGAIAGALGLTLLVHPWGGGQFAQQVLAWTAGGSGVLALWLWSSQRAKAEMLGFDGVSRRLSCGPPRSNSCSCAKDGIRRWRCRYRSSATAVSRWPEKWKPPPARPTCARSDCSVTGLRPYTRSRDRCW